MKEKRVKRFLEDLADFATVPTSKIKLTKAPILDGIPCIVPNTLPQYTRLISFIKSIPSNDVIKETDKINTMIGSHIFLVMGNKNSNERFVICNTTHGPIIMMTTVDEQHHINDKESNDTIQNEAISEPTPEVDPEIAINLLKDANII